MKVLIVYYTLYGHTLELAKAVRDGAATVDGVDAVLRRVKEFDEVVERTKHDQFIGKVRKAEEDAGIVDCSLEDLESADAIIFGTPTRYGNMCAQMKQLLDTTADLWMAGKLENKACGVFTSTSSTHGGQETTLLSMMIPLFHLGMIVVGVPYSTPGMIHAEARGGTPYGASTITGSRGELKPAPEDLEIGKALGRRVAEVATKLG